MELNAILKTLQYDQSPNFLRGKALETDRDFGHIFRKAQTECKLRGAYVLNGASYENSRGIVPVVYVCEADSENEAREIHQRVWNQNAVPFLLVVSRGWVRLYPGFQYEHRTADPLAGALKVLTDFNLVQRELGDIRANSVDNGTIWSALSSAVTPEKRVDWRLLENLRDLDVWLENEGVHDRRLAHSMIGKFVYLQYLRQRQILSDARLSEWGIDPSHVFSHEARLNSFVDLVRHVDEWLNGSVFPLPLTKIREFGAEKIRKVASVFQGSHTVSGQLPLFDIYDFSFIPIETLSVIYEQFLHAAVHPSGQSEGRARGAYYTPVPLVNFMLDRIDSKLPLKPGMRVLDPSCGSGAFLVQCYRKLIERRRQELGRKLRPSELGSLLKNHVFGVDLDEDACQIAELSLALTLLDYIDPPDLTKTDWKLPALRDRNIFCANAFDDETFWYTEGRKRPFQWIVGNPPWKDLKPNHLDEEDQPAWSWMQANKATRPVGGNQLAEAFAWRASEVLDERGAAALLLPAMTLFKYESIAFRKSFLRSQELWSVANFANLADVLFAGRATLPAAALFYSPAPQLTDSEVDYAIETFCPLVANQPTSETGRRRRQDVWNIVVNSSDLAYVEHREVAAGEALPWKIAMWGSPADAKVIRSTARSFKTISALEDSGAITISEGPAFVKADAATPENSVRRPELVGRKVLIVDPLKNRRFLFQFPTAAIEELPDGGEFVSKRAGAIKKVGICEPPHVVVGASRNFAVYTEEFLIVPARQIGVISTSGNRRLLKALALYLNSDFVAYHQFLISPEAGIQKTRSTLNAFRELPIPFDADSDLAGWDRLFDKIDTFCQTRDDFDNTDLVEELNELSFDGLRLSARGRAAVRDLVTVAFGLTRGKVAPQAVKAPSREELTAYSRMLRDELDGFVGASSTTHHHVEVLAGGGAGLIAIDLVNRAERQPTVVILDAAAPEAKILAETRTRLMEQRAQWLYFNRNLRVYDGAHTYILKPLQRLHWTRTQAIEDAREIIADSIRANPRLPDGVAVS